MVPACTGPLHEAQTTPSSTQKAGKGRSALSHQSAGPQFVDRTWLGCPCRRLC